MLVPMSRWGLLLPLLFLTQSATATGLRCGSRLISEGDTGVALERACGAPDHVERRSQVSAAEVATGASVVSSEIIERWIYAGGGGDLMRLVELRRGKISGIQTLAVRGAPPGRCAQMIFSAPTTTGQVELKCGEPEDRSAWRELRTVVVRGKSVSRVVERETWVYVLGAGRLLRVLEFEDGKLIGTETGGRTE